MLGRSDFIVLGLGQDTEFPEFVVQILHIGLDTGADRTVVMILKLLTFRRHRTEKRSACVN